MIEPDMSGRQECCGAAEPEHWLDCPATGSICVCDPDALAYGFTSPRCPVHQGRPHGHNI